MTSDLRISVHNGINDFSYANLRFDNNDVDDKNFLAWNVKVLTIPKPSVDPYKVQKGRKGKFTTEIIHDNYIHA